MQFSRNVPIMLRKCPLCPYAMTKKFTVGDGERLFWVLFYTLLGFKSFSSASRLLCFPQGGLAASLRFRVKSDQIFQKLYRHIRRISRRRNTYLTYLHILVAKYGSLVLTNWHNSMSDHYCCLGNHGWIVTTGKWLCRLKTVNSCS